MKRVVVDPSVFVSALIGKAGSAPDIVVRAFIDDTIEVVVSPMLLTELKLVLARPKFRRYIDQAAANEYVARIQRHATNFEDAPEIAPVTRDPGDDYVVALAQRTRVDAIITTDLDLLEADLSDPPVLTPRQLVDALNV